MQGLCEVFDGACFFVADADVSRGSSGAEATGIGFDGSSDPCIRRVVRSERGEKVGAGRGSDDDEVPLGPMSLHEGQHLGVEACFQLGLVKVSAMVLKLGEGDAFVRGQVDAIVSVVADPVSFIERFGGRYLEESKRVEKVGAVPSQKGERLDPLAVSGKEGAIEVKKCGCAFHGPALRTVVE